MFASGLSEHRKRFANSAKVRLLTFAERQACGGDGEAGGAYEPLLWLTEDMLDEFIDYVGEDVSLWDDTSLTDEMLDEIAYDYFFGDEATEPSEETPEEMDAGLDETDYEEYLLDGYDDEDVPYPPPVDETIEDPTTAP